MESMQIDSLEQVNGIGQNTKVDGIDESLYSRQLYVLGKDAMVKMQNARVLIIGLQGLGVEIAKNVALAGVKSLSLYDPGAVQIQDLSTQFYLSEKDIGKNRAEVSAKKLAELNQYVAISVIKDLDSATLSEFKCVVSSNLSLQEQIKLNNFTHERGIGYINTDIRGLCGQIFVDFGEKYTIVDQNGEEPLGGIVSDIEKDGTVTMLDDSRHGLQDGDYVKFSEVQGMPKLNTGDPFKVEVLGPYAFKIAIDESFGTYIKGGIYQQVKMPKEVNFESLEKQLQHPEYVISDFAKFDKPPQLHLAFLGLHSFSDKYGALPRPYNKDDAETLVKLVHQISSQHKEILGEDGKVDEDFIKKFSFQAYGDIPGMVAFYGGLIAQEVLKCCSSKFGPLKQFFYFDALESLPSEDKYPRNEETSKPLGSRYDRQIAVFGRDYQQKIANSKVFLVGAGAIGCEMLKNWAMMGLGSGPEGKIVVTDMDSIEKSNLNRQFLFRTYDVGKHKSEVAAAVVEKMNSDLKGKIDATVEKVGTDTEHLFNEDFWESLSFVVNALDNVDARTYVDRRCVFFKKPLLESGTLGTKGNTQVIVPELTESYSSSQDPPEQSIPLCTLRSFPNKIDHTIAWAKSLFQGYFSESPESVNLYLSQSNYVEQTLKQNPDIKGTLENIASYLNNRPYSFSDCIKWARLEFENKYNHDIYQLLYNFPADAKTSNGAPFWSGPKRTPTPLTFDINNPDHFHFIVSGANLMAYVYGLKAPQASFEDYEKVLKQIKIESFSPKAGVKIAETDVEAEEQSRKGSGMEDDEIKDIAASLPEPSTLAGFRLAPIEFEKDDDTNHHVEFITAASNCRALNYSIEPADAYKTKFIAGKIIPAIATTTALVTGLVCLELYKVVAEKRNIEEYKNGFINLALPFIGFSEPLKSPKGKYNDKTFDQIWDRFVLEGDMTLQELLEHFEKKEGLEISMLSYGVSLLYASFFPPKKVKERLGWKLTKLIEQVSKKPIPGHAKNLIFEVCCDDKQGEDVEVPYICVKL